MLLRMRRHIRDAGIVDPIHPLVIAEKVSNQQQSVEQLQRSAALNPHLQGKLEAAIVRLTAMQTPPDDPASKADVKKGRKIGRARRSTDG